MAAKCRPIGSAVLEKGGEERGEETSGGDIGAMLVGLPFGCFEPPICCSARAIG